MKRALEELPKRCLSAVARLPVGVVVVVLRLYKRCISPLLPAACRFHPTCSDYATEAVRRHGALRGCWLAARRLLRCHPLRKGGFDPVP